MPVENFKIETISSNDPRLDVFRKEIFQHDLNLDPELVYKDAPHKWWMENINPKYAEDAYKYCNRKWDALGFNNIEAIVEGDRIVGMSGCRAYGDYLRTSMHLYLLKSVRAKYPGIKYIKGGWFERHMNYATANHCKGMFFTVYAHNKKLQGLINNHSKKLISLVDKKYLLYINDVELKGQYVFNNVPQTFFYYKLTAPITEFNPDEFN